MKVIMNKMNMNKIMYNSNNVNNILMIKLIIIMWGYLC